MFYICFCPTPIFVWLYHFCWIMIHTWHTLVKKKKKKAVFSAILTVWKGTKLFFNFSSCFLYKLERKKVVSIFIKFMPQKGLSFATLCHAYWKGFTPWLHKHSNKYSLICKKKQSSSFFPFPFSIVMAVMAFF